MIRLHNSQTHTLQDFEPVDPSRVTMYACGPTIYDTPHIGNARPAVVFDVLFRLLRQQYGNDAVFYARNFTDIDDKIIERAALNMEPIEALTSRTRVQYHHATDALNVLRPMFEPLATHTIPEIITLIATLEAKGHAYAVDGHVFFEIASWPHHGELTGHKQDDLEAGRRVAVNDLKRAPGDFVLWKPSSDAQPGWESPWGYGRPGWHIECSAMIHKHLGETIDIHAGGADLRFPHHECELSQSHAANGHALARFWLHNGLLTVNGHKMAKSAGNFITVAQALEKHDGQTLRLALLTTHYRSPMDWNDDLLAQAKQTLVGWHKALDGVPGRATINPAFVPILAALKQDLNTPLAISELHKAIGLMVLENDPTLKAGLAAGIRAAGELLGIDLTDNDTFLRGPQSPDRQRIESFVYARSQARLRKEWAVSDQMRELLKSLGAYVEDGKHGTKWSLHP